MWSILYNALTSLIAIRSAFSSPQVQLLLTCLTKQMGIEFLRAAAKNNHWIVFINCCDTCAITPLALSGSHSPHNHKQHLTRWDTMTETRQPSAESSSGYWHGKDCDYLKLQLLHAYSPTFLAPLAFLGEDGNSLMHTLGEPACEITVEATL